MPVCPECGIDVPGEGLCAECRKEQASHRAGGSVERSRTGGAAGASRPLFWLALALAAVAVFAVAFFIGRSFAAGTTRAATSTAGATGTADTGDTAGTAGADGAAASSGSAAGAAADAAAAESGASEAGASESGASALPEPEFDIRQLPEGPPYNSQEAYMEWMQEHTDQVEPFLSQKWERYKWVISWNTNNPSLTHPRVIQGFLRTPREYFCREWNRPKAYAHAYLSIGYGQTISGPEIVSRMTNALNPQVDHKVLEIGTGSGYQSAYLAELSNYVYTIEIVEELAEETDQIYTEREASYPQYANIRRKRDDGYYGWEEHAPFDRIIVTCGIDHIPPPLLRQLSPDGIMVIPVGPPSGQTILKITKRVAEDGTVTLEREDIYAGTPTKGDVFVPFTAEDGGVHSKDRDQP